MRGQYRWQDVDYNSDSEIHSIYLCLDKLYAKHFIMNIHKGENGKYDSSYTAGYNSQRQCVA